MVLVHSATLLTLEEEEAQIANEALMKEANIRRQRVQATEEARFAKACSEVKKADAAKAKAEKAAKDASQVKAKQAAAQAVARHVAERKKNDEANARDWVRVDPAGRKIATFIFVPGSRLWDVNAATGTRRCSQVFVRPPTFWPNNRLLGDKNTTEVAISYVWRVPPLADYLESAAVAHLDGLENSLILDQPLNRWDRSQIRDQIKSLAAPGKATWENWIRMTDRRKHDIFNKFVETWLTTDVDLALINPFILDETRIPLAAYAAAEFFDAAPSGFKKYLGIKTTPAKDTRHNFAYMSLSASEANARSLRIRSGVRFEEHMATI